MARLIKKYNDNHFIEFDVGRFDSYCIYLTTNEIKKSAIKDIEIFTELARLKETYGNTNLYSFFIEIYERTTRKLNKEILDLISNFANSHPNDQLAIDQVFSILYAGMVAEENKEKAKLKKKIKRLGVHQILIEDYSPETASNFSRGKKAEEIIVSCQERGF